MSMQDLPIGRRRDDQTDLVQTGSISTAPPWDSVLDRLDNFGEIARRSRSDGGEHPRGAAPEIAAATGRGLALGSPIDALRPSRSFGVGSAPSWDVSAAAPRTVRAARRTSIPSLKPTRLLTPGPLPAITGDSFFQPLEAPGMTIPQPEARPKRRLFGGRRAAREAQARIAAEFAAPPPPPGFYSHEPASGVDVAAPPPPPPGFGRRRGIRATPASRFRSTGALRLRTATPASWFRH